MSRRRRRLVAADYRPVPPRLMSDLNGLGKLPKCDGRRWAPSWAIRLVQDPHTAPIARKILNECGRQRRWDIGEAISAAAAIGDRDAIRDLAHELGIEIYTNPNHRHGVWGVVELCQRT